MPLGTTGSAREKMPFWFAVQTIPRSEQIAKETLALSRVEVLLPLIHSHRRTTYLNYVVDEALFPGYLFARFEPEQWSSLKRKQGVRSLVRLGAEPAQIDEWIIDEIRERLGLDGFIKPLKNKPIHDEMIPGQTVEITAGAWFGLSGAFIESLSGGERVAVLMSAMGAQRVVEFDRAAVRAQVIY